MLTHPTSTVRKIVKSRLDGSHSKARRSTSRITVFKPPRRFLLILITEIRSWESISNWVVKEFGGGRQMREQYPSLLSTRSLGEKIGEQSPIRPPCTRENVYLCMSMLVIQCVMMMKRPRPSLPQSSASYTKGLILLGGLQGEGCGWGGSFSPRSLGLGGGLRPGGSTDSSVPILLSNVREAG